MYQYKLRIQYTGHAKYGAIRSDQMQYTSLTEVAMHTILQELINTRLNTSPETIECNNANT